MPEEQCLIPVEDLLRPDESTCALFDARPPKAAAREANDEKKADDEAARLASREVRAPAPPAPRPPPRRLAIPSSFGGSAVKGRTGPRGDDATLARASPVPVAAEEVAAGVFPAEPSGDVFSPSAGKENRAASPPKKKPRFASFKTAEATEPKPKPKPETQTQTQAEADARRSCRSGDRPAERTRRRGRRGGPRRKKPVAFFAAAGARATRHAPRGGGGGGGGGG
jgi:hypothetical protein